MTAVIGCITEAVERSEAFRAGALTPIGDAARHLEAVDLVADERRPDSAGIGQAG